ncbi:Ig-like domain-containing protein, partial [Yoonia sp.]|uniref:Ig-like domain-containing protein n=1 Tax=Yoonia sp. TaxID=2212373 RepID=UPI0039754B24
MLDVDRAVCIGTLWTVISFAFFAVPPDQRNVPTVRCQPCRNVFSVVEAEAVSSNQVKVVFSENLAANTVDVSDFSLTGFTINTVTIPYGGKYNEVLLELGSDLNPGSYYTLTVNDL